MYIPQHMPFFQISHVYQGIDIPLFCHRRRVYAASVYISGLFCYKPKKMVVTVVLQNIISMYITLKTSYVFILCVYYLKIKLTWFCQCRPMYINCGHCHRRTTGGEGGKFPPPEDLVNINLYMISCINWVEKIEKDAQRGQKSCRGGIAQGGGNFCARFACSGQYISSPPGQF